MMEFTKEEIEDLKQSRQLLPIYEIDKKKTKQQNDALKKRGASQGR